MGTNVRDRLSIGRRNVDEGVSESCADLKISGTSVVPYVHWRENTTRKTRGQWKENKESEPMVAYGKCHTVLDQPLLVLTVQGGVMRDLIQPPDPMEEVRIVLEVSDVYRDLRGRSMEFVRTRSMNHIPQLDRAEISSRRLNDTSSVNQGP